MTHRARTKDEMFMLKLYEEALKQPEIDTAFDRYKIGALVSLHPKGVDTICTLLCQANFVKKISKTELAITPQGIRLVKSLLEDS